MFLERLKNRLTKRDQNGRSGVLLIPAIPVSVEAFPDASAVWSMLSTRYSGKGNLMLMSQTEEKIHVGRQGERNMLVYVNDLQHLWADLDDCDPLELPFVLIHSHI